MLRERRSQIGLSARKAADQAIGDGLDSLLNAPPFASTVAAPHALLHAPLTAPTIGPVAGYWPMPGEPDLIAFFERLHLRGVVLALPRVERQDAPLHFDRWQPGDPLEPGPFGTLHPARREPVRPRLILLPCLGFDRRRQRLGYGGGYYDRTLEQLTDVYTIGVAYDCCEIGHFDAQQHDLPLTAIVTESRTFGNLQAASSAARSLP